METLHPSSVDLSHVLPREAFSEIILILCSALPRPLDETPAEAAKRDRAAMAAVALLLPETGVGGRLAAQFVAADAWAMDCLKLAQERQREPRIAERCRAQAMGMMREGKSALKALERLQAQRRALAKDEAAAERAAWVEHAAVGMMAEALEGEETAETRPGNPSVPMPSGQIFGHASTAAPPTSKTRFETTPGRSAVERQV